MADNATNESTETKYLEPPTITALRQEARHSDPSLPVPMERTLSQDIREECEDLKEAAEQTPNVVMDLDMDGRIKWVSPSWKEVIGTDVEEAEGQPISDIVLDNKTVFEDAVRTLQGDDSRSQIVRFAVRLGPASVFRQRSRRSIERQELADQEAEPADSTADEAEDMLNLEGQGIMVYESSGASHVSFPLLLFCFSCFVRVLPQVG
jgi:serine/threonine-protein kinase RIM15